MSAMKDMLAECVGSGFVPAHRDWVDLQARRLSPWCGERLSASASRYPFVTRSGKMVGIDVIPVDIARWLMVVLPDTAEALEWALESAPE